MTVARSRLVDVSVTRWYHCISRCVRQAFLLAQGELDRKAWIERRLEELAEIFAISVGGFAILDNHLHLLLRLDPERADGWSDEEVVRRWGRLFPPRDKKRQPLPISDAWVQQRLADPAWVARAKERLVNLGWFMKCLKEPLARLCNREDNARGAFFEGRYKSIALLDEEALLAVCAYIDLNPVAAGVANRPEAGPHTSVQQRVAHIQRAGRGQDLAGAAESAFLASQAAAGLEEDLWLCPIEDRRHRDSLREGMLEGFTLGSYLLLLDYTGRLYRHGKARISREMAGVFARLGIAPETWTRRMQRLRQGRLLGRVFAGSRTRLKAAAARLGRHHLANLAACPAE